MDDRPHTRRCDRDAASPSLVRSIPVKHAVDARRGRLLGGRGAGCVAVQCGDPGLADAGDRPGEPGCPRGCVEPEGHGCRDSRRDSARDVRHTSAPASEGIAANPARCSGPCGEWSSDTGALRWRVDGVLIAPGTNSIMVTGAHTVAAFVRDSRGATTTEEKVISCL